MIKAGDIIICRKDYIGSEYNLNGEVIGSRSLFIKNKYYTVSWVGDLSIQHGTWVSFNGVERNFCMNPYRGYNYYGEYFYTLEQSRKIKLKRLEQYDESR